jgi:hypothetical protein
MVSSKLVVELKEARRVPDSLMIVSTDEEVVVALVYLFT